MKRKPSAIVDRYDPWEIEVAYYAEHLKLKPNDARALMVISWMLRGNLQPLAAALRDGPLDPTVASQLAKMIDADRLTVRTGKRGARASPEKFTRDIVAAISYKNKISTGMKSDQAVEEVAGELGLTTHNVRKICTWFNKKWDWK
jgi:hypothetical protein